MRSLEKSPAPVLEVQSDLEPAVESFAAEVAQDLFDNDVGEALTLPPFPEGEEHQWGDDRSEYYSPHGETGHGVGGPIIDGNLESGEELGSDADIWEEPESESESEDESESDEDSPGNNNEVQNTLATEDRSHIRPKTPEAQVGDPFYPYTNKGIAMADASFNGPRGRFSRTQKTASLEISRELCGKKNAPSLYALSQAQKVLETKLGNPTRRETTQAGTVWYQNDINDSLAKDISNPLTRRDMQFYPHLEYDGQRATQVWHGAKMLYGVPDHQMTPMIRTDDDRIYYVNELVKLSDGSLFIPRRWFLRGELKEKWCFGDYVDNTSRGAIIRRTSFALRPSVAVSSFTHSYNELMASQALFVGFADGFDADLALMPHPLRKIAGTRDVFSIPLIVFVDDVSGGMSKQWNKYLACYMSNGAIPREALQKELNVRYVGATNQMSAPELLSGIAASIKRGFANPTVSYDALTMREVLIRPYALMWPGDNPMQAEACSCGSLKSNFMCRTYSVGGTQDFKRTDEGYLSLIHEGVLRDPQITLNIARSRLELALLPGARGKVDNDMALTGVKDGIAQPIIEDIVKFGIVLRKGSAGNPPPGADEINKILRARLALARESGAINALLEMDGVDIHQDTPTEILHTVLLGVVKYFWAQSLFIIKKDHHMDTFQTRLRSINSAGLGIPPILADYMCDYSGSLIGKHFKTIAQVMPFATLDLVPQSVQDVWFLIGRLVVLLWVTEINSLDVYLAELKDVIDKLLVTTAICSPSILLEKPKFHFLVHLPRFITRFGPAILFSTERYESYHAIFRAAMVKSNRQAPSRDVARAMASIDRVQHICMGGYWRKSDGSGWEQASAILLQFFRTHKVFSKLLGMYEEPDPVPGKIAMVACAKKRQKTNTSLGVPWSSTLTAKLGVPTTEPGEFHISTTYESVKRVISSSGDSITAGTQSIIQIGESSSFCTVIELLLRRSKSITNTSDIYFATVQPMRLGATNHTVFNMPTLTVLPAIRLVKFPDIICAVNLQHDCKKSGCNETQFTAVMKEREITTQQQRFVKHKDSNYFIVNTQSLHNNQHIVNALPSQLQKRSYTIENRGAIMTSAAQSLQQSHSKKSEARKPALKRAKEEKATEALALESAAVADRASEAAATNVLAQAEGVASNALESNSNAAVQVASSSNILAKPSSNSLFSTCTLPVLKHICALFKVSVAAGSRKIDFIENLDAYFESSGITPPTTQELSAMKQDLSLKRKREPPLEEPDNDRKDRKGKGKETGSKHIKLNS